MSVGIIWSLTNGGTAISTTVDHGNASNGATTTAKEFFIRHDGANEITGVGFYVRQFSSTYQGHATAAADIAELLGWGDASDTDDFGGFQINMNAVGAYPVSAWPTLLSKSPTNGSVFRTGVGDSEGNSVAITTASGASASGTIQTGNSPNVRFKSRIVVPTNEDTVGIREWDMVLVYTYTS